MSGDPGLQRRHRHAVWWTIGGVTALYGIALLVVMGVLSLAHRSPPADPAPLTAAASHATAPAERRDDRLAAPAAEAAALPDWVQRRRLQDNAAPWRVDDRGHVVWVRPRTDAFSFSIIGHTTP